MAQDVQPDYGRLRDYLCDMIREEQLKLGYARETIRFYSPCASIGHILGLEDRSCDAVWEALGGFAAFAQEIFGEVEISRCSGERICFRISAQGAEYVHGLKEAHPFLAELIDCFGRHGIAPADVRAVFERWSDHVRCIHIGSAEFDDVYYFADGVPDEYRYCVKFDEGHAFYHRFLREDFEELFDMPESEADEAHG